MHLRTSTLAAGLAAVLPVAAISPEQMLSAPRYGTAQANPSGEYAIYTANQYSFKTAKRTTWWNLLNLQTGAVTRWHNSTSDLSDVVFVGPTNTSILYLNGTSLYSADLLSLGSATKVVSLPGPFSGLKVARTPSGDVRFLVTAKAYPNGTVYDEETAVAAKSTAKIYNSIYPRHWDTWLSPEKNAVFGGTLKTGNGSSLAFDGKLTNYVTGICNVTCAESPYDQGGPADYELSPDGAKVAFMTKDIHLPLANFTSTQIYLVPFEGTAKDAVPINPRGGTPFPEAKGASSSPVFSRDSSKLAYLQMNGIDYESDRTIIYVADVSSSPSSGAFNISKVAGDWDRAPGSILWSRDGKTLFVDAADLARNRVFAVPVGAGASYKPANVTNEGAVAGFEQLPDGRLLVSDSKIWSSRDIYSTTTGGSPHVRAYFRANEADAELKGLGPQDVSEFYYSTNTSKTKQQAWIVKPTGFQPGKKYPLAFITHGGPQGAHANSWSTRWNFKVWADQGYVVIAPNPTASTGFGQNLTDAVQGRWGSYPYWDLVHAWKYVNETLKYVDTSRGIEAGASFGGYMTNWMQGHEMGRWFKALVTHDGSTSTLNQYASDELWFMNHDFRGQFNETGLKEGSPYYDWNPLLHVDKWATPHFVIHNDLDFRLPVSEGLLLFNMLQVKGVPSKFLNFPDENHWVLKPENSLVWHTEIFKWINYYSGISNATSPY
ncbi:hypothetical protein RB594_003555 [Gaeumannomyces avenae]